MSKRLFTFEKDWQNNACIDSNYFVRSAGFKKAGDVLVEEAMKDRCKLDYLVYPICHSYRHYIELQLKLILDESRFFLKDAVNDKEKILGFEPTHNIQRLWKVVKVRIRKLNDECDDTIDKYITKKDLELMDTLIDEFHKIDPASFSFRYPTDREGNKNLQEVRHIPVKKLKKKMGCLSEVFEKFNTVLYFLNDQYQEEAAFNAEIRADMENEY